MDVMNSRIVKALALEFIVGLLEGGVQFRVIADCLLQSIVLSQGRGRICQGSRRRIKQSCVRLQLAGR